MSTAREDDELIEAVRFPCAKPGEGHAFREFARRHGDFAIVACAAVASAQGTRLAVGGVADRPTAQDFGTLEGAALDDALQRLRRRARGARRPPRHRATSAATWCASSAAPTIEEARACRA